MVFLLVSGGHLLRSLHALMSVDPGHRIENLAILEVSPPESRFTEPADLTTLYGQILRRAAAAVGSAAWGDAGMAKAGIITSG